ncbi:WSC domain-containing protein, variant 2 [Coprinopsis cinerea AmutBmut pab1-1]|nr:WSC domain-containing protein, variant 2 [Coprinopsis cinerea AmutBmut pab1-1]
MDPSIEYARTATCTSCKFKENKSNYWTAVMYFKHSNGSFIRVPQFPNHLTGNPNGGMTVYYIQPTNRQRKVTAFPKGFRMISGNPMLRARKAGLDPNSPEAWSSSFRCWETSGFTDPSNSSPPGAGRYDTVELPNKRCPAGIRANLFFPACWDGKNLDSPDHASHVAFFQGRVDPNAGMILMEGTCPSTHPVRLPLLFFETAWDTRQFNNMWPSDGSQPFVLSHGDPTGYGHHGDYVFGWEEGALQRAMDNCFDILGLPDSCRQLTQQSDAEMNQCVQQTRINERVEGVYLPELPGCNPVQKGPGMATMVPNCRAISTTIGAPPVVTNPPPVTNPPVVNPPPPVTNPGAPLQTRFGQCGGQGWTGPTQCQPPYACQVSNQWYSQCI